MHWPHGRIKPWICDAKQAIGRLCRESCQHPCPTGTLLSASKFFGSSEKRLFFSGQNLRFFFSPDFVPVNALQVPFLLTDNSMSLKELLYKAIAGRGWIQKAQASLPFMLFSSCVICKSIKPHSNQFLHLLSREDNTYFTQWWVYGYF